MEDNDSLRTHLSCCVSDSGNRVRLEKQNVAVDYGVEWMCGREIKEIRAHELNIRAALVMTNSFASFFNDRHVAINPRHFARRSNEPGRKQRDIAHSAAQIEDIHPTLDSGRPEVLLGPLLENACLELQALLFLSIIPQNIVLGTLVRLICLGHCDSPLIAMRMFAERQSTTF
jgi:hypothetical protein